MSWASEIDESMTNLEILNQVRTLLITQLDSPPQIIAGDNLCNFPIIPGPCELIVESIQFT
jgi:hypothetical protein